MCTYNRYDYLIEDDVTSAIICTLNYYESISDELIEYHCDVHVDLYA